VNQNLINNDSPEGYMYVQELVLLEHRNNFWYHYLLHFTIQGESDLTDCALNCDLDDGRTD